MTPDRRRSNKRQVVARVMALDDVCSCIVSSPSKALIRTGRYATQEDIERKRQQVFYEK